MNLKKCARGHYYDADLYVSCPRCEKQKNEKVRENTKEIEKKKKRVTGWLVGIEGSYYGTIFELEEKMYSIGAAAQMDICLSKSSQLSEACQIRLSYDKEHPGFVVSAGNARELAYINGELILSYRRLKARDKIRIGEEVFLYIPLCDTDFSWK